MLHVRNIYFFKIGVGELFYGVYEVEHLKFPKFFCFNFFFFFCEKVLDY